MTHDGNDPYSALPLSISRLLSTSVKRGSLNAWVSTGGAVFGAVDVPEVGAFVVVGGTALGGTALAVPAVPAVPVSDASAILKRFECLRRDFLGRAGGSKLYPDTAPSARVDSWTDISSHLLARVAPLDVEITWIPCH